MEGPGIKITNILKIISILAYSFIILTGDMIGIPFIIWLLFAVFDFGNIDQVFAILAILGIFMNLVKWKNPVLPAILSFLMMLSPVISRTVQAPYAVFNYLLFQIPLAIFIICYLMFIILIVRKQRLRTS